MGINMIYIGLLIIVFIGGSYALYKIHYNRGGLTITKEQVQAIKCAMADLAGSYQATSQQDYSCHDWRAHYRTMEELKQAFPDILLEPLTEEDTDLR
jgi:hypothetical protein